jgi:hypothetical protein
MAKPPKQSKPKTNSTPSNTPVGPVAIVNTQGKISVRGIPKPSNISTISITELKRILGFDEMENPRSEWNTSRDAARKFLLSRGSMVKHIKAGQELKRKRNHLHEPEYYP